MSQPSITAPQPRRLRRVRARRAQRLRGLVGSALGAVALLLIALTGVGGSYALWTDTEPLGAGTIRTGDASLVAQWSSGHSDEQWKNLLPGESARQQLTLSNIGDVPLSVTAGVVAVEGYELRVAAGGCTGQQLTVQPAGTTPVAVAAIRAGQAATACLEVRATNALTPGATAAFSVTFHGTQESR